MATETRGFKDLGEVISRSSCYCLNENPNAPFANLFMGDDTLLLKSDADEQLILHLEFQDAVKLASIRIGAPAGETAPRLVKLYTNRPNLGFSDASDIEPTQTLEFEDPDALAGAGRDVELRFVKFQRVSSLTIFVEENHGDEVTALSSLKLFGERIAGTNMNELKKVSDE
ncbi:hypothetical protein Poli38472_001230 [Pythium oligandrum]|uniref:PITH domain-containing protein n=1 Tax=Pythium oligandrum TaxID=41045 RepID=A0A8K1FQ58_PYTOL|nr:hypothetical protein Poli38472_001230 [Pythium oligandrum]|eukprot:TMW69074.1 hypothetical protein Poli38472_001230 [Pythium oligandrum]